PPRSRFPLPLRERVPEQSDSEARAGEGLYFVDSYTPHPVRARYRSARTTFSRKGSRKCVCSAACVSTVPPYDPARNLSSVFTEGVSPWLQQCGCTRPADPRS